MLEDRKNSIFGSGILFVCALIWGFAFVPQSQATGTIGFVAFNALRFAQAVLVTAIILIVQHFVSKKFSKPVVGWNKSTFIGGTLAGSVLFLATNIQQYGLPMTTVGKASFITAMYIVFVPLLGLLMGKKPTLMCCYAILLAIVGFFLMCNDGNMSVGLGDAIILICALLLAVHICFIDLYCPETDPIKLTFVQFFVCAALGVPAMAIFGFPTLTEIQNTIFPLLYLGVASAGIGFTLQTIGQKYTDPAIATLIMSLESIVGILAGTLILKEHHSMVQLTGCLLVFIAVFLAQFKIHKTMLTFEKANFALTEKLKGDWL